MAASRDCWAAWRRRGWCATSCGWRWRRSRWPRTTSRPRTPIGARGVSAALRRLDPPLPPAEQIRHRRARRPDRRRRAPGTGCCIRRSSFARVEGLAADRRWHSGAELCVIGAKKPGAEDPDHPRRSARPGFRRDSTEFLALAAPRSPDRDGRWGAREILDAARMRSVGGGRPAPRWSLAQVFGLSRSTMTKPSSPSAGE